MNLLLAFLATLAIIFAVPMVVYGVFSALFRLKEPENKLDFLVSVMVQKFGTCVGFVGLYYISRDAVQENWVIYAAIWFVMFAIVEIGQALAPNYSKKEAAAGIVSEAVYFPMAAYVVSRLLG